MCGSLLTYLALLTESAQLIIERKLFEHKDYQKCAEGAEYRAGDNIGRVVNVVVKSGEADQKRSDQRNNSNLFVNQEIRNRRGKRSACVSGRKTESVSRSHIELERHWIAVEGLIDLVRPQSAYNDFYRKFSEQQAD